MNLNLHPVYAKAAEAWASELGIPVDEFIEMALVGWMNWQITDPIDLSDDYPLNQEVPDAVDAPHV